MVYNTYIYIYVLLCNHVIFIYYDNKTSFLSLFQYLESLYYYTIVVDITIQYRS